LPKTNKPDRFYSNQHVGNILLLLPALSGCVGALTLAYPEFGTVLVAVFLTLFLAVVWFAVLSANRIADQQRALKEVAPRI